MTDKKVFIYCRKATTESQVDRQNSNSLETQEQECRKFCEENNLAVVEVFKDVGSGAQLDRPGLTSMRARFVEVDGLVFTSQDRLSRNAEHMMLLVNEMTTHSISFHSVVEQMPPLGYKTNGSGQLSINKAEASAIRSLFNQYINQ